MRVGLGLLLFASNALGQRTTVSLDFGWRVHSAPKPKCDYSVNLPGIMQTGGWIVDNVTSADGCAAAACKANAQAWSFCQSGCGGQYRDPWYVYRGSQVRIPEPHCVLGNTGQLYPYTANWTSVSRKPGPDASTITPQTQLEFDDSTWRVVDLPHDASIELPYTKSAAHGEGFIADAQTVYRKHFSLPTSFQGRAIVLEVDGALMYSSWWLNGVQVVGLKTDGYLPLTLRIDNVPGVQLEYGNGKENVLVAWTDNSASTGWWFEGSGLARHARLSVAPAAAQIRPFGVATPADVVSGSIKPKGSRTSDGLVGAASLAPTVDVRVAASEGATLTVEFALLDDRGTAVGKTTAAASNFSTGDSTISAPPIKLDQVELWSVARPYLYTLSTTLRIGDTGVFDTVNTTVGIRDIEWNAADGLRLNGQATKMRGFCNHENFAGIGAAIPPRVDLFRIQQMRGVGGNAWRTSHNPPEPALLDIADRLGILVLDENRVFATTSNCPGDFNDTKNTCSMGYVPMDLGDVPSEVGMLALRDRNHASVIWYSLCNEFGCGPGTLLADGIGSKTRDAIRAVDKTRAITGNMGWQSQQSVAPGSPISTDVFDVMGVSHQSSMVLDAWHASKPDKLIVMTECCSCPTQRGEDSDIVPFRPSTSAPFVYNGNENSDCVNTTSQRSNAVEWVGGTFIWTLHDYIGEPSSNSRVDPPKKTFWPHVSSSFGSFDLAGFPKAPVWWYRSWWLAAISADDAGRPPLAESDSAYFCRIVESWRPSPNSTSRYINVYTNAPKVRFVINGVAVRDPVDVSAFGKAELRVTFAPGNITAECLSSDASTVVLSHTKRSWGTATRIVLSIDAPSVRTGTGSAVYLDGQDVALIRASVVDTNGVVVHDSTANITFSVSKGPARLVGVGNGDPANIEPNKAPWKSAYHGLVRAIFRTTLIATGSVQYLEMLAAVNPDAGTGPLSSSVLAEGSTAPDSFEITATSPGLASAKLTIPLSVNPKDDPLKVAAASVGLADLGE